MAPRTYTRGEPCEECGSTRYITSDDGYTYCQRGHQQTAQGTAVAHGEEAGELVITGRKSKRKDSDGESIASTKSGLNAPKAFEQYLLCLQLILRKQLQWLIKYQHLPEELESLVRDLWALRLRRHRSIAGYESGTETEAHSQQFSSQSEGETSASDATRRSRSLSQRRRSEKVDGSVPSILDCVGLIYLACLLLRKPLTTADLYAWMQAGGLLYYSASKGVPISMRERLPAVYQDMLEPQIMSNIDKLHTHVQKMFGLFTKDLGMTIPPLSQAPLLYRWLLELTLPIECYAGALRLCRYLNLEFASAPEARVSTGRVALTHPEVRLMAVLVVTTKLLFPFDNAKRCPSSATDLSALSIDWNAWATVQSSSERQRPGLYSHPEAMQSREVHLRADDGDLDDYLERAEENFANEDVREHGKPGKDAEFRRKLFRMFDIDVGRENAAPKPWKFDQEADARPSPPMQRQLARGEVEDSPPNYQPRPASEETLHPAGGQSETQTAREPQGEAGRRPDAHRNSQSNADRFPPALLGSSRAKPSPSTNTPRITGSLLTKRIAEDKGVERVGGAVSKERRSAHGVMDGDIDRAGSFYRRFRSVEELRNGTFGTGTSVAKMFHERAADVVGVNLEVLTKAVLLVEERVLRLEEAARRKSAV